MDDFLPPQPGLQEAHDMQQQMIQRPRPTPRPSKPQTPVPYGGKSRKHKKSRRYRKSRRHRKSRR
jgi:hypothetical protein